ncbi:unnamed protein product [Arctogadus glacialis]
MSILVLNYLSNRTVGEIVVMSQPLHRVVEGRQGYRDCGMTYDPEGENEDKEVGVDHEHVKALRRWPCCHPCCVASERDMGQTARHIPPQRPQQTAPVDRLQSSSQTYYYHCRRAARHQIHIQRPNSS